MEYRRLGRIALGIAISGFSGRTVSTGWWGACSNAEAGSLLREARGLSATFPAASHKYREGQAGAAGVVWWCAAPRTARAASFAAINAQGGR